MVFEVLTTIIFFAFLIPISINMVKFIGTQRRHYYDDEDLLIKKQNRLRIKRVIILTVLLPIAMLLIFLGSHLIDGL